MRKGRRNGEAERNAYPVTRKKRRVVNTRPKPDKHKPPSTSLIAHTHTFLQTCITQNHIKLLSVSVVIVSLQVCIAQTSDVRRVRVCVFSRFGRILRRGGRAAGAISRNPHDTLQLRTETVIYFWKRGETGRPINFPYFEEKRKLEVVLC